jgi:hypothetical protein
MLRLPAWTTAEADPADLEHPRASFSTSTLRPLIRVRAHSLESESTTSPWPGLGALNRAHGVL